MAPIETLFIFLIFFFLPHTITSLETCTTSFCNELPIKFPFRLSNSKISTRCGYQGFNISCRNDTQPILNLPESSEPFIVRQIDYISQNIYINDPDDCMPQRFFNGFNVSSSPFNNPQLIVNFTFLNCSKMEMYKYREIYDQFIVPCLSGDNYTVLAMQTKFYDQAVSLSCFVMKTVLVPISSLFGGLSSGVELTWSDPNCGSCEEQGEICGFKSQTGSDVGCSSNPQSQNGGLPISAKYGMIIGAGLLGLLCLIGLSCYACSKVRDCIHRRHHSNTEFSISIIPLPSVFVMGLDGQIIEKFPKTQLDESGTTKT